jgi:WD40 repeat protein
VLNPGNITNLALLDTPLDNSVPGLAYTWFYAFDLSPDGQYFATQGYYCPGPDCEDYIKVWQILPDGMAPLLSLLDPNGEEMWDLYTLAFSPDSSLLASGGADQKIRIWSIPEGQLLRTLEGHKAEVEDLDFSPDGELLASASSDNTLRLWRVSDGSLVNTMRQKYEIYDVEFSPDGQSLASGSRENNANGRLWEVSSGRVLRTFSEIENTVLSIAYSPDGGRVAMGTFDGDILVYDARSGNRIARFRAHNGTVASLAFSTDGAILASGGNDQKVHLWSLPDGELLTSLPGHLDRVWHVIFAPQGNLLYTVARYDALRVWGVQP